MASNTPPAMREALGALSASDTLRLVELVQELDTFVNTHGYLGILALGITGLRLQSLVEEADAAKGNAAGNAEE